MLSILLVQWLVVFQLDVSDFPQDCCKRATNKIIFETSTSCAKNVMNSNRAENAFHTLGFVVGGDST